MTQFKKETTVTINEKKYNVKFPNIGQFLEIEGLKQTLTNGKYAVMTFSGLGSNTKALDLADAIAYFSVLIPDLFKTLKVESYQDVLKLDMDFGVELIRAYTEEYAIFYNEIEDKYNKKSSKKEESVSTN